MKRFCALLLILLLALPLSVQAAPATAFIAPGLLSYITGPVLDHLTVGNPNPMRGEFFTDLWGNITSDQDVRSLIHAYNLVRWDGEEGMFTTDPSVVTGVTVTENALGDRTYTMVLYDDLYYSDGTPVTAWDYAFSMLLQIAPEMAELGATPARKPQLVGYQDYIDGTVGYLAGMRVLSDNTLSIIIDNEYLPFFYEMALLSCNPYPIRVIAPGVEVRDDGFGVYLANEDDTIEEPVFTAELLKGTILNEQMGYRSHPMVVSGPYILTSWDGETAEFELNPYYKGNVDGQTPTVLTLTYEYAGYDDMIEGLKDGKYDLLNKVMNSAAISEGMELVADDTLYKTYGMSNYPRIGMSYISFACEKEELSSKAVRQAIAWCMDREQVMTDYTSYYGLRVDGYYGVGQWLYGVVQHTIQPPVEAPEDETDAAAQKEYEDTLAAYDELTLEDLVDYEVDIEKARELLEKDGWKVNDDGIREKTIRKVDENGEETEETLTLELTMAYPEGNTIAESFEENFIPNLKEAGISLTLVPTPISDLLMSFYYPEMRGETDLIFLASNFDMVFDPSTYFREETDEETGRVSHVWITTGLADEELYDIAVAMRETEPGDVLTYCQHWLDFQTRFNEVLPMLPIYSNVYFDFYTEYLRGYAIEENTSWAEAIVGSYMSDEEPEEEEEELLEEEGEDGLVEFD